jgi:hypothetical protein
MRRCVAASPTLAASLVVIEKTRGRPGCHCQRGEKHPGHYLTYKEKGKTRTVYVPLDMLEDVKAWVKEHKRLRNLSREISQLTIALVRSHVSTRKRKAGRP